MRFNCGPDQETQRRRRRQKARDHWCSWHRWFAWYPVRIKEGDCRWLEFVEREAFTVADGIIFETVPCGFTYRAITN